MPRIPIAILQELIDGGDWAVLPTHPGIRRTVTIRRTTTHLTPDWARDRAGGGWDQDTYFHHMFLTFTFADTEDVVRGQVLHGNARAPWVGRTDSWVSQKRALELVAEASTRTDETTPPN